MIKKWVAWKECDSYGSGCVSLFVPVYFLVFWYTKKERGGGREKKGIGYLVFSDDMIFHQFYLTYM